MSDVRVNAAELRVKLDRAIPRRITFLITHIEQRRARYLAQHSADRTWYGRKLRADELLEKLGMELAFSSTMFADISYNEKTRHMTDIRAACAASGDGWVTLSHDECKIILEECHE